MSGDWDTHGEAADYQLLLVDDDEHVREAVKLALEQRGYGVTECSDALEALALLRAGAAPDLILLDLMMPHMDGWQFRLEQKRNPAWAQIPVIALSADQSAKAQAMDAQSYLPKPFDHGQLYEAIERVMAAALQQRSRKAPAHHSAPHGSLGQLASQLVEHLEQPLGYTLANLQLARNKVEELEARLDRTDAFSAIGIRQLLTRAQRGAERIAGLTQGTATFAALMSRRAARPQPRILVVDHDQQRLAQLREWLAGDYTLVIVTSADEALHEAQVEERFDAVLCELAGPTFEGVKLYQALLEQSPELVDRLIFMSEGAFGEPLRAFLATARRPQLRSPLQPQSLRQLLARQIELVH